MNKNTITILFGVLAVIIAVLSVLLYYVFGLYQSLLQRVSSDELVSTSEITSSISPSAVATTSIAVSEIVPTSTATPTNSSNTAVTTKKITLTGFNAEIYVPVDWNYTFVNLGHANGGFYFTNSDRESTFNLVLFDGGIYENFCREGDKSQHNLTIAGNAETIFNCSENGQFTSSYGWINQRFAFETYVEPTTEIYQILESIKYTGANPF